METILYVGEIGCTNSAACIHTERVGKLIEALGYRLFYCCDHVDRGEIVNDIRYKYSDALSVRRLWHTLDWLREQYFGSNMKKLLEKTIAITNPEVIILYNPSSTLLYKYLLKLCRRNGIKLVIELTEWRDPDWTLLKWPRSYMHLGVSVMKNKRIQFYDRKCGNMIGISQLICEHYRSQGGHVVQLPPLFGEKDFSEKICLREKDSPIRLVFAGSLESKDHLFPLIIAIQKINAEKIKFTLDIIGPSEEYVQKRYTDEYKKEFPISSAFVIHGRMPHEKVLELVHKSDFSVLLRDNARYAKAGVSTKFSEAACVGTPSICTAVGGTDLFVKDGVNGILIKDNEIETITEALKRIGSLSESELNRMKEEALNMGRKYFWDLQYKEILGKFLKELR